MSSPKRSISTTAPRAVGVPASVRRRLRTAFALTGRGVHLGQPGIVRVSPAPLGSGLRIVAQGTAIPIEPSTLGHHPGCTSVHHGDRAVLTVEHLLASLFLTQIPDAIVEVQGPEVPILDGTIEPFLRAIQRAGLKETPPLARRPLPTLTVEAAGGRAQITPRHTCKTTVYIDFPGGPKGSASYTLGDPIPEALRRARTFARLVDLPRLRRQGRGRGACPCNTLLWRAGDPSDEPVAHLLVDALGDRAFGGLRSGHVELWRPSHALSAALWRAVDDATARCSGGSAPQRDLRFQPP